MNIFEIILLIGSYLLGSVPFGHLMVKKKKGINICQIGSGSDGATAIARELGKEYGRIVLLLDIFKGFLVTALAFIFFRYNLWIVGLAIAAVVAGHVRSIFLGFKGGKGVATFIGVVISLLPFCFTQFHHPWTYAGILMVLAGWLTVHKIRRQMGLSSLLLMGLLILYFGLLALFTDFSDYIILVGFIAAIAIFIFYNHRGNWRRIKQGKEPTTDLI